MWYLEAFDKKPHIHVRDFVLKGLSTDSLQSILGFGDTWEIDGIMYPPEAGGYDVPVDLLPALAKHINTPFTPDSACDYQVEFYVD